MPSTLRSGPQSSIAKPSALLQRKQKMTLSQTYYLAHVARGKLSKEAAKPDHDLRLLVGHANLLDGLMLDLADAEREQESWFNQTVKGASSSSDSASPASASSSSGDRHIRWPETLPSVTEDFEEDSDDSTDDEAEATAAPAPKIPRSAAIPIPSVSVSAIADDEDSDEDMADDPEEHAEGLRLHRTPSHSSPPELMDEGESESDSEADDMPPSPPAPQMQRGAAFAKPAHEPAATQDAFYEEGFYLPQRQPVAVF